ncbi:MAG TPA: hypothetical protein VGS58_21230, partial [Candidatus Sulfopaludibacter sp.]|nr:hypothetical protein [Candidatus Sulfopaludibacter sp.]
HTSFVREGYAAVRFTTPSENYANQHSATDTFANASPAYAARVARMNGAVLATLALAPEPPVVSRPMQPRGQGADGQGGTNPGGQSQGAGAEPAGPGRGAGAGLGGRRPNGPGLTRGPSGYDAALRWANSNPEPDLAGYAVVIRSTTSALWEREIYVGNVTDYLIPNLSIDDVVIGVKAIDKDGNQSLVSAYEQGGANPGGGQGQQPPQQRTGGQ